jgi:sugar lactone lactonase YvrE
MPGPLGKKASSMHLYIWAPESSTQMGGSIQGVEPDLSTAVTTFAGSSSGYTDATGTSAKFYYPRGITTDGTNLYVADQNNHKIRKIVITTGVVTILAGSTSGTPNDSKGNTDDTGTSARFDLPTGITTDGTNLYVTDTDNHRIRKIVISTGVVTTLAGSSSGNTDATGTSAQFSNPIGITTDGTNLYVADKGNHRIRKIVISTGVVTTLAGSSSGSTNHNTGTSASFNTPLGITTDGTNLYVADYGNDRIRKIVISTGVVTTLAGSSSGNTDATGTSASFNNPVGITTDGTNLYVADQNNQIIRKIVISTGVVTTFAGSSRGYTDNATGTSAKFYNPIGITTDGTNLYVADFGNHLIRQIVISSGAVTTLAGTAGSSGSANGTGTSASFYFPRGITTDGTNLYVADQENNRIRKIE